MRGTFAGLLTLGLVGSPLAAQVEAPPKPPATPPVATQPGQPPKPGATPPFRKEKTGKVITFTSPSIATPVLTREEWFAVNDEDRIEIKDITVREFFERLGILGYKWTFVIKENLKDEKMPQTSLSMAGLAEFIMSLDKIADDFEVKLIDGTETIVVVSAKPKPASKPNILFVPVNLEPLLAGINEPNEVAKIEKRMEKIKRIQMVIDQGVELDSSVRGLKPTVPLKMMVHPETNLLFLAGQAEQVEAASKILSALGAHIQLQDMMGGGWRTVPGGSGMGGPGMGMGFGGMGGGGMMSGMGGPWMGGVPSNLPGAAPGGFGGPMGPGGAPAPKPKPGASVPGGGGEDLGSGNSPNKR